MGHKDNKLTSNLLNFQCCRDVKGEEVTPGTCCILHVEYVIVYFVSLLLLVMILKCTQTNITILFGGQNHFFLFCHRQRITYSHYNYRRYDPWLWHNFWHDDKPIKTHNLTLTKFMEHDRHLVSSLNSSRAQHCIWLLSFNKAHELKDQSSVAPFIWSLALRPCLWFKQ